MNNHLNTKEKEFNFFVECLVLKNLIKSNHKNLSHEYKKIIHKQYSVFLLLDGSEASETFDLLSNLLIDSDDDLLEKINNTLESLSEKLEIDPEKFYK